MSCSVLADVGAYIWIIFMLRGFPSNLTNKTLSHTAQYPFNVFYVSWSMMIPTPLSCSIPPEYINLWVPEEITPAPFHLTSLIPRIFMFNLSISLLMLSSLPFCSIVLTFHVAIFSGILPVLIAVAGWRSGYTCVACWSLPDEGVHHGRLHPFTSLTRFLVCSDMIFLCR